MEKAGEVGCGESREGWKERNKEGESERDGEGEEADLRVCVAVIVSYVLYENVGSGTYPPSRVTKTMSWS